MTGLAYFILASSRSGFIPLFFLSYVVADLQVGSFLRSSLFARP
jgi:hypothetical protein